ncbi:MAG TPA: ABC transporter permease subunit [Candidatus Pristimantibacillus sp.]|jgi:ABC-2 type transport system permease protein|nr:ABC transporter permease subunit [Candidatus Pristimantibacillus sp.]
MFRTIFLKTLFEKRWMTLWWALGSVSLTIFIVLFFPTLRDSFGKALEGVPDSLRSLVGSIEDYQQLGGYLTIQVFQQMIFLPLILGVILATGLLAGDENEGTLQTLLTHPVSRTKVYFHKLAACAAIVGIVVFGFFLGSWLGALMIGERVDLWRLFQATWMAWLVSMAVSSIGFALAGITGKRALSGSIAGAYAFIMYVISSLVDSVKALKPVDYLSPFHYFNRPSPLKAAFDFGDMTVLLIASVVFIVIGYIIFRRRDVYQR